VKIATLFSGVGAPEQGAKRVYPKHEVVFACEFDKFARQSYEANYDIAPEHFHKDVHDLDATQYKDQVDILIGGSPCQAFSLAGLRQGTEDERGQLIYQYIRVVDECRPKIIIYENVKGIMSIDNGNTIKDFVQALRDIGYHCHYGVVNTKDYGVPQNRERLFLVGFLDSDLYHKFHFADKQKLIKRLKDVLEDDVDDKYYLSQKMKNYVMSSGTKNFYYKPEINLDIARPLTSTMTKMHRAGTDNYISDDFIQVPSATKQGYETATTGDSINLSVPNSKTRRGRVGKQVAQCLDTACNQAVVEPKIITEGYLQTKFKQRGQIFNTEGISPTLDTCTGGGRETKIAESHKIRKLTPRECLRLQDFPDDFKIAVSDSQAYKQAGNSMSVNILEMIFNQIEKARRGESIGLF